ncbi:MAG: hypothetical protein M1829_003131 [Trizodia sp. TS-e1964]|nr:MAG: hypothetical protein M1829_003131 [Trizodia sp. TS-e1964]
MRAPCLLPLFGLPLLALSAPTTPEGWRTFSYGVLLSKVARDYPEITGAAVCIGGINIIDTQPRAKPLQLHQPLSCLGNDGRFLSSMGAQLQPCGSFAVGWTGDEGKRELVMINTSHEQPHDGKRYYCGLDASGQLGCLQRARPVSSQLTWTFRPPSSQPFGMPEAGYLRARAAKSATWKLVQNSLLEKPSLMPLEANAGGGHILVCAESVESWRERMEALRLAKKAAMATAGWINHIVKEK